MKKWLILGAISLLLLVRAESTGTDINELEPVGVIQVLTTEDGVRVRTDTGAEGYGAGLSQALENLHSSAPSRIFLDTAQNLLVDREEYLEELSQILRPACQICLIKEEADLELASRYLKIHGTKVTLLQYRAGVADLPLFYSKEGRSQLVQ